MGLGTLPDGEEQLRDAVAARFLQGAGREGRPHQVRMHTHNTPTAAASDAATSAFLSKDGGVRSAEAARHVQEAELASEPSQHMWCWQ
jgi:hypothetical protein